MITRTDIINRIIEKYGFSDYLEIGVRQVEENFNKILAKNKDGVDPFPISEVKYKMTSDDFFSKYGSEKKYDLIFVDGLHTHEQSYIDVINSMNCLNQGGVIVMHDCNPPTEYHIRSYEEYLKTRGQWNGTVFKGFIQLKSEFKEWNCFIVDEDFGCGVLTKRNLNKKFNSYDIDINELNWEYFNDNRKELLDLVNFNEFIDFI
jgi:hypothetical protein